MKSVFFFFAILNTTLLFAQIERSQLSGIQIGKQQTYAVSDTIPKVIYLNNQQNQPQPAWFLNKILIPPQAIKTLNPDLIQAITVEKGAIKIAGVAYKGIVRVTMKEGYQPSFITLNELKKKYTKLADSPTIFLLNEKVIHANFDEYLVDEKYILKIEVDKFKREQEGLDLTIVKLITRTEENLKKANTIILRGKTGQIAEF